MANRRVLVKRRRATQNIRKITRTMQLIATARFQAAFKRAVAGRPYTEKLTELTDRLASATTDVAHPLMRTPEATEPPLLVVLTSNRGLCGGYNAHVLRSAGEYLQELETEGRESRLIVVGKKGNAYLEFHGYEVGEAITDISDLPRYDEVEPLASRLMDEFIRGEIGSVHVAYMKFISTGRQRPVIEQVLPLKREVEEGEVPKSTSEVDYEYSPEPRELLAELLPATVKIHFFQCFSDASVSEQVARMVAMKAATDAAEDMIKRLTQQYNRARQTAITMELLDIVGGAAALE
ncbi:MAG: ATP synthase F1 subunit gamma [Acidobacteria bacterium]|nr:MAG: ATP synthase F1 subunit gamma [Acidobacteriota bacterium]